MAVDLTTLNPGQRGAVEAPPGQHLVIAGAGTGKTRTLVHRVAWLLERGVDPKRLVLLTFSRRAAHEMLSRVAEMVGPSARAVRGGTFHSFANRALRRHGHHLGYEPGFTILDRGDSESLIGLVRAELGLGGRGARFPNRRTILNVLSRATNLGVSVVDVLESQYPHHADHAVEFERLRDRYAERKRTQGVMDFDDLLVMLARLLTDFPQARQALSRESEHVLVDEYQDTNRLQAKIAALLSSVHGNLMVVGDEAQSIYGFRGADVRNILDFQKVFPEATLHRLEQNYRSSQAVLDVANAVLDSAAEGYDKRLVATHDHGPMPALHRVDDEHAQADQVVDRVLSQLEAGVPLREQAVLFRSGHHANLVEVALTQAAIPYKKYGGIRFGEAAHVKDVLALLRVVANPFDLLAWVRVLTWFDGVGPKTAERLALAVRDTEGNRLPHERCASKAYGPSVRRLSELLEDAQATIHDLADLLDLVVSYYDTHVLPELHDDVAKRRQDLQSLGALSARFTSVDALLSEVALDPVEESDVRPGADEDTLTLSTIHSAKGLEWDSVALICLGDGAFPSMMSLDDPGELEEERRLLYVAVTRARRTLDLYEPRFLRAQGRRGLAPGCSLLADIPQLGDLLEGAHAGPAGVDDTSELDRLARIFGVYDDDIPF